MPATVSLPSYSITIDQPTKSVRGIRLFELVPKLLGKFGYSNCVNHKAGSVDTENESREMQRCSDGVYSNVSFEKGSNGKWALASAAINIGPEAKKVIPISVSSKLLEALYRLVVDELQLSCNLRQKKELTKMLDYDCCEKKIRLARDMESL